MLNVVSRVRSVPSLPPVQAPGAGLRTTAPAPSSAAAAPLLHIRSVKARGAPPPGTTQASIDMNVNLAKALYRDQPPLKPDDVDRSPAPEPRPQRHETTTNEDASRMVERVVEVHRSHLPRPTPDGGLEPVSNTPRVYTPADAALLTQQALRAVGRRFGDHAPYIPLGHPPDRARRHKGNYGWTLRTMLWALEEFYVIGTFVPIAPEIAVAGRRETEYPEPLYVAASSQGV
ncbi:unnamed protein product [Ectocarpus sp. 6 AP-2014]